ncbi:MAG: hypothetical protein V1859_06785 [archaeon]
MGVKYMLYEDNYGRLYFPDEVEELFAWEREELGISKSKLTEI